MTIVDAVKRVAYGALFVLGVPWLLVVWARRSAPMIPLRAFDEPVVGLALAGLGLCLVAAGMWALVRYGRGLPMNAFPPPRFVRQGVFRWIGHPIYLGFGLVVPGVAVATGSAAGLWLVTPVIWMAMAALVWGYERHDLRTRFGEQALTPPLLSLPPARGGTPTMPQRLAVLVGVLGTWLLTWLAVQALGRPPDAFIAALPVEMRCPVVEWTEWVYVSAYLLVPLTPFVCRDRAALRLFAQSGLVAIVTVSVCWLTIPIVAGNRAFVPTSLAGDLLAFEQRHSLGVAAFPAFHVLWACLAAVAWSANARAGGASVWMWGAWCWAWVITFSCLTTGQHTLVDVAGALLLFVPLRRVERSWAWVRAAAEYMANSWREWRVGPVRLIVHALWAGAAACAGLLVAGMAAGPEHLGALVWVALCVLVGAGAWAQWLEGSSKLLRPFGWYGGLFGGILATLASPWFGIGVLPVMVAFALAAPWIQMIGRMRCLVQGCCHGAPASSSIGIRYLHRRSRVTQLANLAGVPIHATPLYSIAGNLVIAVVLLRLRALAAPDPLILGVYFILAGLARFVEESYRGEPQTPLVAGLRIYQWLAVASLLAGIGFTMWPLGPGRAGLSPPDAPLVFASLGIGLVTACLMGVDFPQANRRFSRLAPAD